MSVLIKGYPMPKTCNDCDFCSWSTSHVIIDGKEKGLTTRLICDFDDDIQDCSFEERSKDCPLVEMED